MILVAPTAFKGSISARAAARAIAQGARAADTNVIELPLSDGGPGLIDKVPMPAACSSCTTLSATHGSHPRVVQAS